MNLNPVTVTLRPKLSIRSLMPKLSEALRSFVYNPTDQEARDRLVHTIDWMFGEATRDAAQVARGVSLPETSGDQ